MNGQTSAFTAIFYLLVCLFTFHPLFLFCFPPFEQETVGARYRKPTSCQM